MADDTIEFARRDGERAMRLWPTAVCVVATACFLVAGMLTGFRDGAGRLALVMAVSALVIGVAWWLVFPGLAATGARRRQRRAEDAHRTR